MIDRAIERLETLARTDPTIAPLEVLQVEALSAAAEPTWRAAVPALERAQALDGRPLLDRTTLAVDVDAAHRLLVRLAAAAGERGAEGAAPFGLALRDRAVDPLALLGASVAQDEARLADAAEAAGVDRGLLAALAGMASLPLLLACGEAAGPLLEGLPWEAGYCPVCAAWPTLAELRGLDRQCWLRCGRCGAGWSAAHHRCAFCGNRDHRTLGYLAPEASPESRRALTCDACVGYLKAVATVAPIEPTDLALTDLTTLELDVAAVDRGYARPTTPGFPLAVELVAAQRRSGWLAWRR